MMLSCFFYSQHMTLTKWNIIRWKSERFVKKARDRMTSMCETDYSIHSVKLVSRRIRRSYSRHSVPRSPSPNTKSSSMKCPVLEAAAADCSTNYGIDSGKTANIKTIVCARDVEVHMLGSQLRAESAHTTDDVKWNSSDRYRPVTLSSRARTHFDNWSSPETRIRLLLYTTVETSCNSVNWVIDWLGVLRTRCRQLNQWQFVDAIKSYRLPRRNTRIG